MNRKMLRDDQWARIEQLLPGKASDPGCTAKDNRIFVEAVLWILRTGTRAVEDTIKDAIIHDRAVVSEEEIGGNLKDRKAFRDRTPASR